MKKTLILLVSLILLGAVIFLFWGGLLNLFHATSDKFLEIERSSTELITEARKKVSLPPPIQSFKELSPGNLDQEGVVEQTNAQRENFGLPPLKVNPVLSLMAEAKVRDMFEKGYFAHISPDGTGVGDLAKEYGYNYIAVGENLAMGNFQDDASLVKAWMDSPGHRANILNKGYEEIGVAVLKGSFNNRTTWIAVQHFGRPLSSCPVPDQGLKSTINQNETEIEKLQGELDRLKAELDSIKISNSREYRKMVEKYNNLVYSYNNLVVQTKKMAEIYNEQVQEFNKCAIMK